MQTCKRCVLNSTIPNTTFDENGVCNYCHIHDKLEKKYPLDGSGQKYVDELVQRIKHDGRGKKYDCVVGVSGGCDSSYLLHILKTKYDLRPLAITFDNTWSTNISVENIYRVTSALDIDLYTHVMDNKEFNDLCRSFLYASTPDLDVATDIAIAKLFYVAMEKFDINYSFCGHSFRSEGTVPLGWTYMDGKYIKSVHEQFGKIDLKTYPNLDMDYWLSKLKKGMGGDRIRLLYYEEYNKEKVKKMLTEKYGWQWYGGHHHENEWTKFVKSYLLPRKFNIDKRYVEFSALVRSGQMTKDEALEELKTLPKIEQSFVDYVLKRLEIDSNEFEKIMSLKIKSHTDYDNYKKYFKENRAMFKEFFDKGLVSQTFYEKYVIQE